MNGPHFDKEDLMSRKRTPKQESTETTTTVAEAPAAEAPAPDTTENSKSFADGVEQGKWTAAPDPFGIAKDNVAGVRLFESKQDRQVAIMFGQGRPEDKPSQEVINTMKEAGYRWNPADRIWAHP